MGPAIVVAMRVATTAAWMVCRRPSILKDRHRERRMTEEIPHGEDRGGEGRALFSRISGIRGISSRGHWLEILSYASYAGSFIAL